MEPIRIVAVSGSLRQRSLNRAALRAASELAPDGLEISIHGIGGIPPFNADHERDHGFPPEVVALREAIHAADALVIATPEYNYSIPGVLKNAIDWLSRGPGSPLDGKPGAILGAGGRFGTLRAQLHLREVLLHNRVDLIQRPLVMIDAAASRFDDDLRLVEDRYRRQITQLLEELAGRVADRRRLAASR